MSKTAVAPEPEPILQDIQFKSFFDQTTCVRKGLCPIACVGDPVPKHSLYYEQHGNGPKKVVLIMGLVLRYMQFDVFSDSVILQ